ncbi:hypothetical protein [Coleofasciculus sp. FACHB-64]|uniref:hypothetical protein n=1 Tax=Cyanophyceae TaxID=3028117 RepID=UPI0016863EFB|nr:hypothetical protein [Coleofasciculus sp. FACHB-64]
MLVYPGFVAIAPNIHSPHSECAIAFGVQPHPQQLSILHAFFRRRAIGSLRFGSDEFLYK